MSVVQESRPTQVMVTSREEGMPYGTIFHVIGWTGFDQAVVRDTREGYLLVLNPADFVEARPRYRLEGSIIEIGCADCYQGRCTMNCSSRRAK